MLFILFILVLLFLIICVLAIFLFDGLFGGLDFASSKGAVDRVAQIIHDRKLETGKLYDLGSCRGDFVKKIAKRLPTMQIVGVDDSWFRTFLARARSIFLKNLKFRRDDIFKTDVSAAKVVYIYLPQELMSSLQTKLQKELNPGSVVISNKVYFPDWQPVENFNQIFVYEKNESRIAR